MLKASQKSQFNKLIKQNALLGAQLPLRSITSSSVFLNDTIKARQMKSQLDNYAQYEKHIGVFRMNKEHRHGTLSSSYIQDLKRFLTTLNQDNEVKIILMSPENQQSFCHGTDFRTLHHYSQEQNHDKVVEYLTDLYSLQTLTAKINKPIIAAAHGPALNSGATFLQATGIPTSTPNTLIAFNEVQFGFVPHGGTSYYLSRLPGELGTYLALTGLPLTGSDARVLNLTDMYIDTAKAYKYKLMDIMDNIEFPMPTGYMYANYKKNRPMQHQKTQHKIEVFEQTKDKDLIKEATRRAHENMYFSEYAEPRDRLPETVGQADMRYQMEMNKYDKSRPFHKNRSFGYFDGAQQYYQNYFKYISEYVKDYSEHQFSEGGDNLKRHIQAIDRCFYANTLEEIIDNLKRENTTFSKRCLEQMNHNSALSMKLALRMLRQARNLDYKGCLQNEINVSLNKIQDKDFDLGVKEILMKPGKRGTQPQFEKNVSDDQVNSYFSPNQFTEAVKLDVVEKALLPTREYFMEWSDQVRLWVNEESTPQAEVRRHFDIELKEALQARNIDLRDRSLDVPTARAYLYHQQQIERLKSHIGQRMDQIATDTKLREHYYDKVNDEFTKLQKQPKEFYSMVNRHIQEIFEQAYIDKLQNIYFKNKEIHDLEKRRMYLRFKKFLMSSRLITFYDDKLEKLYKRHMAMPFKEPHLSEQWEESFLHKQHPEIETSIIHHISKAIGKKTVAPLEIAKQYLSNPSLAKNMTVLTFDKEELEKIRRDILSNPLKYEKILESNVSESYSHFPDRWKAQKIKDDTWIYWYRILNDGKTPLDNIHMWKNYEIFKEFVTNIEKKALSTLELCVTRLIQDFDHQEGMNEIKEFKDKKERETKKGQLMRLMGTLGNITKLEKERKIIRSPKNETGDLIKSTRSLDDVQRIVINLTKDDQQLKALLPSDEGLEKNPLVQQFKKEMLDLLLGHIEFVLLNQHDNYPLSKKVLEERLASITNPQNKDVGRLAKLGVIDQFLSDHNAEQTIKHALQLTRSFFLHEASAAVERLSRKVIEVFRVEELGSQYLMMYQVMNNHNQTLQHPVVQKLLTYHSERDRQKYIDKMDPTQSMSFYTRNFINMLGEGHYDRAKMLNAPVSQKEALLDAGVKQRLQQYQEIQKIQREQEESYQEDIEKYKQLQVNKEVDEFNIDQHILSDPQMNIQDFTVDELNILQTFDDQMAVTAEQVEVNADNLIPEMPTDNWLHIIWALQTQYGIDCKNIFRFGFKQQHLDMIDFEGDLKQVMGRQDATFDSVAELAGYAKQLTEAFRTDMQHKHNQDNMEEVYNFYLGQNQLQDEITQQSIFEKLKSVDDNTNRQSKLQQLRKKLLDTSNAYQIQEELDQLKKNIEKIMINAPAKTQKNVKAMLESNSPYINYEKVQKDLLDKKYEDFYLSSKYVDKKRLERDIKDKDLHNKLMNDYKTLPCDTVSLVVARETIAKSKIQKYTDKNGLLLDEKLRSQVIAVLEYINDQCQHISHERRKNITVGEFMQKHQFLNVPSSTGFAQQASFNDIASDIIKSKLESTLLDGSTIEIKKDDSDAPVEWEYAGYVSNPFSHAFQEKLVKEAALNYHGVDDNATIGLAVNSELDDPDAHEFKEYTTRIIDEITGIQHIDESQRIILDQVLLDAYNMVKVKDEFGHLKNKFKSDLLNAYTRSENSDEEVAEIINEYTELRYKDMMLNSKFVEAIQGPYATYYLRMLREEIASDLNIDEEVEHPSDLSKEAFEKVDLFQYDAESIHNMSDLSNTDAVGFDNIEQRAANPEQNRKLAHQTIFDELLAEYFVQKRQQVVNINELMDKLAHKFTPDNDHVLRYSTEKGELGATKDPLQKKNHLTQFQLIDGTAVPMAYSRAVQLHDKFSKPSIMAQSFTDLMDLDIATAKAIEKNKNGLGPKLGLYNLEDDVSIPEYMPIFDVRRPPKEYVEHKLKSILEDVFEIRKKLEKTFTRNELYAYDKILIKHLTMENLLPRIKSQIEQDKQMIVVHGQNVHSEKEGIFDDKKQSAKTENQQKDKNEGIKNEDSLFKFLAYTAMLEKTRKQAITKRKNDEKEAFELNMFDEYYKSELLQDAKRNPREINEEIFYEHKNIPQEAIREGYVPIKERKNVYFEGYKKYKENKKEGYDRNKMFYILEQFYAKTQQEQHKGDSMNDAQKAIVDYFDNPENTQFFMRNKIQ